MKKIELSTKDRRNSLDFYKWVGFYHQDQEIVRVKVWFKKVKGHSYDYSHPEDILAGRSYLLNIAFADVGMTEDDINFPELFLLGIDNYKEGLYVVGLWLNSECLGVLIEDLIEHRMDLYKIHEVTDKKLLDLIAKKENELIGIEAYDPQAFENEDLRIMKLITDQK